jgi:hypothetical protein
MLLRMRIETFTAWMFIGFWLLITGTLLHMSGVVAELATFLAVTALV